MATSQTLIDVSEGDLIVDEREFRPANEVFKDPNAFDFLSSHGGSGSGSASALARQSLYYNFDPLIAGRPSILPPSVRESMDLINMDSPPPPRSTLPAAPSTSHLVNCASRGNARKTELKNEYQGLLLSLSKKESQLSELDEMMNTIAQEQSRVRKELMQRKASHDQLKQVIGEYEKTISQLIEEKEKDKMLHLDEKIRLTEQREAALEKLNKDDAAFSELYKKYEMAKEVLEGFKQNKDTLERYNDQTKQSVEGKEEKSQLLQSQTQQMLSQANLEMDSFSLKSQVEIAKLTASLKKIESKATSLERDVEQKKRENSELSAICDELIDKIGTN